MPKANERSLMSLRQGAGMVRTNGRFAIIANSKKVAAKVREALNSVANIDAVDNPKYELIDTKTDVYLIFSFGGGTGCGTFIDMAYLVRSCDKNCKIAAFALLPKVFKTKFQNAMDRVLPNGYGAVEDLDWFMCHNWSDNPIDMPVADGNVQKVSDVPFDVCMFVDNQNENHDVYKDNRQLEEMIALSLVTSVGELSKANTSVLDNISVSSAGGAYDVEHKRAWVSGLGVCEAIVNSDELRKIYAHNVAIELAGQLIKQPKNIDNEVMAWINKVKIKEHEADDVIDSLLKRDARPMSTLDKDDYEDALNVAQNYIAEQQADDGILEEKLQGLISRVAEELRKFINDDLMNRASGGGVAAAGQAVQILITQMGLYLKEMKTEIEKINEDLPQNEYLLENISKDLKRASESAFSIFKSSTIKDDAENIVNTATEIASLKRDLARHNKAVTFFNDMLIRLNDYSDKVDVLKKRLDEIIKSSTKSKADITGRIRRQPETFQYNLTDLVLDKAELGSDNIVFSDFLNKLGGNKIADFFSMDTSAIWRYLVQYGYNMDSAKNLGNMDINGILDHMSDEKFADLVNKMVAKSSPLLPHDFHGYKNGSPAVN